MYNEDFNAFQHIRSSDYGVRIYKDGDALSVKETGMCRMWNLMVFESELYVEGHGIMTSGLFMVPSLCPRRTFVPKEGFKEYLLCIPDESVNINTSTRFYIHS